MENKCSENQCSSLLKKFSLLAFLCLFPYLIIFAQNKEPRFEHLTIKDGLPDNRITTILQDHLGYMWFGTTGGLSRYDGYKFNNYKIEKGNPRSISDNWVGCIYEDHLNNLWIGTQPYDTRFDLNSKMGGLNLFDRKTETFIRYVYNGNDSSSINSNYITSIKEDDIGNLWIGTNKGLNLFNRQSKNFYRVKFLDQALSKETYRFLSNLENKNHLIQSITRVENNANIRKQFVLREKTILMAVIMGEETADYGWIENSDGKKIIECEEGNNFYAGGRSDNRIAIIIDTLESGTYFLCYKSDMSFSYNNWRTNNYKPYYPEWWGIQLFRMDDSLLKTFNNIQGNEFIELNLSVNGIIRDIVTKKILIATNWGLLAFNSPKTDSEKSNIIIKTSDRLKLGLGFLTNIYQSKNGVIWIGASVKGLFSYDPIAKEIKHHRNPLTPNQWINSFSNTITEDSEGIIWYGNPVAGLIKYNPPKNEFSSYVYNEKDEYSLSGNTVWPVYFDRTGVLWVGTNSSGINKWDRKKWKFNFIKYNQYDTSILSGSAIKHIYEDSNNRIWLATNRGINIFELSQGYFGIKYNDPVISNTFNNTQVTSIIQDTYEENTLWIGIAEKGLFKYDLKSNTLKHYEFSFHDEYTLSAIGILNLVIGNDNDLWIGSINGLFRFDKRTDQIIKWKLDPDDSLTLADNVIANLFKDNQNEIWILSNTGGLFNYDKESKNIIPHTVIHNGNKILSICELYEDSRRNFWVGTDDNGFYSYDRMNEKLKEIYSTNEGLPNNNVNSILNDDKGNLWIGTRNGLSKFNIKSKEFRNYFIEDGLCSNYFFTSSKLKLKNGMLFFGTDAGLVYFHPDSIVVDSIPPQVVIQNISLFNRPDEKIEYEGFISEIDEVTLPFNQNDLHFEYVGLHYGEPLRNRYKYILEGFDKEWIDAGNSRTATYTNLDPGEYKFRVKACNRDGIWDEAGASLKIIINPPVWATTWAYLLYIILFGSILYYAWRMQLKRVRVKHEFEMSKFETQKLHEVDEMKSRFFTNISHEFRTPLTLIIGPVKQIIDRTKDKKTQDELNVVHRSANKLLHLVNQLLDISKLESGNMRLQVSSNNIVPLLKGLLLSFASFAERKKITLNFNSSENELLVYIDQDKVEKIVTNILSNALKFTSEGGKIDVNVNKDENYLNISIRDTGIGIPKEKLLKIFDRFYQVDESHTREQEGTGIGLALTKELVELHKGKIRVESKENKGTTFLISLPLGKKHFNPDEIIADDVKEKGEVISAEKDIIIELTERQKKTDSKAIWDSDKDLLLIVEDNSDVRKYIISHLEDNYRILEAVDGEDGLEIAINHIPDLIISDVMMPKMDGFALCNRLKNDERTSHIPIIILTAKATSQDKIEGYETGADDYIMKPFEATELNARIKNLIDIRKMLQEKFRSEDYKIPRELNSMDEQFIKRLMKVINEHLSDEEFSIEELGKESAMSRGQIYKKVKALTGKSPSLFLRSIRLSKAKRMIKDRQGTISEIAYSVGFNSPSYFTKCFNEEYGYPPTEIN